jgi:transposase
MFIRVKTSRNSPKKAVQIVEGIRDGSKVRQRIVRHVGTAHNDREIKALKDVAEHIKAGLEQETTPALFSADTMAEMAIEARDRSEAQLQDDTVSMRNVREEQRVIVGIHDVFGKIYKELGLDSLIPVRRQAARNTLRHMVMARIATPESKRRLATELQRNFGIELSLSSLYRAMDGLDERRIQKLNDIACNSTRSVLGADVDVAFYDCTTLYYESFREDDGYLKNGFSKDNKVNQPQVLLALLTTHHGLPLGYEVYPGNTFEGNTLSDAIARLKQQYKLRRVVFVADSALLSKDNLSLLDSHDIEYIVAARLKKMSTELTRAVLSTSTPSWHTPTHTDETHYSAYKELSLDKKRRLIVSYNTSRAEKDRHDREKNIKKLQKKLEKSSHPASLITNHGYKRFLNVSSQAQVSIDEEKVRTAAQWDGLHGVITNIQDMEATAVLQRYHRLWEIEECFRISKHDLRFRPIFHWTPSRIRAHIAICFMTLLCVKHLQYRVAVTTQQTISARAIIRELTALQCSIVRDKATGTRYAIPSAISDDAKKILKTVGCKATTTPYKIS